MDLHFQLPAKPELSLSEIVRILLLDINLKYPVTEMKNEDERGLPSRLFFAP